MGVEKNGQKYDNGGEYFNIVEGEDFNPSKFGYRHQQVFLMFVCLTTAYSMRACIGVALVGMVDSHYNNLQFNTTQEITLNSTHIGNATDISDNDTSQDILNISLSDEHDILRNQTGSFKADGILNAMLLVSPYPKFTWSKKVQDAVISSFFWGYMVLQIPAGQLVHRFGPRYLLGGALTINCVVSFCFPWAAYYGGWILAVIFRIVQGLSQACIIPGMYGFFGQWTPLEERSRLAGFAMGGQAIGTVLGLPVTAFLSASPLGWPGIFRFYGLLSGLVAVLVFIMIRDKPADHTKISAAERNYIEDGLGLKHGASKTKLPVPWKQILRCRALYGILLVHISHTWGQLILFAEIPAFMDKVMGVNIQSNGLLTALPFLVMWFSNFFFNWLTDHIIIKKWLSVTNARKLANSIGSVMPAVLLVVLAFVPKHLVLVEIILVLICTFKISALVGFMVTLIDIAPNFASTMMSISNFMSNLVGSQSPMVTGFILGDVTSEYEWRKVFFVSAGLYFFGNLAYVALSNSNRAPWNDPIAEENDEKLPEKEPMLNNQEESKEKM